MAFVVVARDGGKRIYFNVNAPVGPFGSMAERTLIDPKFSFPVPDGVADDVAAALGNAGLAAWLALSWRARLRPGETVLILGATGISGLIAVTAAKQLGAGRIIAAGRNRDALARAKRLGELAVDRPFASVHHRRAHVSPSRMIPKKPAPHSMRGGYRFSEKIMLNQKAAAATYPCPGCRRSA